MFLWEVYQGENLKTSKIMNLAILTSNNQFIVKKILLKNLTKKND